MVINFVSTADQYTCIPHIRLPFGHHLFFSSLNCSTGKVDITVNIIVIADNFFDFIQLILIMAVYNMCAVMIINIFY